MANIICVKWWHTLLQPCLILAKAGIDGLDKSRLHWHWRILIQKMESRAQLKKKPRLETSKSAPLRSEGFNKCIWRWKKALNRRALLLMPVCACAALCWINFRNAAMLIFFFELSTLATLQHLRALARIYQIMNRVFTIRRSTLHAVQTH